MSEIREFIKGLVELEFEYVSLEIDGQPKLIEIDSVIDEVDKLGVAEIGCIFFEEMDFISANNELVEVYGVA